jgi:hypothetical protein
MAAMRARRAEGSDLRSKLWLAANKASHVVVAWANVATFCVV